MSISKSLNFSLFQSSSKEEDIYEENEEDDYDWGKYLTFLKIVSFISYYLLIHHKE